MPMPALAPGEREAEEVEAEEEEGEGLDVAVAVAEAAVVEALVEALVEEAEEAEEAGVLELELELEEVEVPTMPMVVKATTPPSSVVMLTPEVQSQAAGWPGPLPPRQQKVSAVSLQAIIVLPPSREYPVVAQNCGQAVEAQVLSVQDPRTNGYDTPGLTASEVTSQMPLGRQAKPGPQQTLMSRSG